MQRKKSSAVSRRSFLKRSAAAAGALALPAVVPSSALGRDGSTPPGDRIGVAVVGLGIQGKGHFRGILHRSDARVAALCDADARRLEEARSRASRSNDGGGGSVPAFRDFREAIAAPGVDAVLIATPDHWHAVMALEAMAAGKDVYCEKPLTLTIGEARRLVAETRRLGRVFQTGSQQRSDAKFRQACELVRNGMIGELESVRVSIRTGFLPHPVFCDLPAEPVPEGLDWDLWLGPAPVRPYHRKIAPPFGVDEWGGWRNFTDYSGGGMTDWGAHHVDIAQWGLGADGSGPVEILPPDGRGVPLLTCRYANGVPLEIDFEDNFIRFTGSEGSVEVNRSYLKTEPESLAGHVFGRDALRLEASADHHGNWLHCIRTRSLPICDVAVGAGSVTACHLGNLAKQLGRPLRWDPAEWRFVGDPEAERLIERPMRSPWAS
jgi:predicted dehydrogenase